MSCQEVVEFLMDYLNGELPSPQRVLFDDHLAECPECVAYLAAYCQTIAVVKLTLNDPPMTVVPALPVQLVQAILMARRQWNPEFRSGE